MTPYSAIEVRRPGKEETESFWEVVHRGESAWRTVSKREMSHEDAVVLAERLNREAVEE